MAEDASGFVIDVEHHPLAGHHHADRGKLERSLIVEGGHMYSYVLLRRATLAYSRQIVSLLFSGAAPHKPQVCVRSKPSRIRWTTKEGARMNKIFASASEALAGVVRDGQTIAVGGFGLCGIPEA
ncbi:CoA-transferase, partial [Staphylococcus hominis]|uniref:CoA-transferase n=1 Tax=Staphylococcus hominis TaxID=1290 RepID=UPI002739542E